MAKRTPEQLAQIEKMQTQLRLISETLDLYALDVIEMYANLWEQSKYLSFGFLMNKKRQYQLIVHIAAEDSKKALRNGFVVSKAPKDTYYTSVAVEQLSDCIPFLKEQTVMLEVEIEEAHEEVV